MAEVDDAAVGPKAIEAELLATFRRALGRPDHGAQEGFLASGGDSLTVVETILEIEARHGVTLSAAEFMALDTAERLARHVAAAIREAGPRPAPAASAGRTMLTVVQDGDRGPPLICAYGVKGEAAYAITLAELLPPDRPVAALQVRGGPIPAEEARTLRDLAETDAERVLERYGRRPCVLVGYSLGAHTALALGHALARRGAPPALLVVLDDEADLDRRHFAALRRPREAAGVEETLRLALQCTPAEPIAAPLLHFRSEENAAHHRSDPTCGWGEIATGGVVGVETPANHNEFPRERTLRWIVPRLLEAVDAAPRNAPPPDAARMARFEARRAAREGDLEAELARLRDLIAEDPGQPSWLHAQLAEALLGKGDVPGGLAALAEARRHERWPPALDLRMLDHLVRLGLDAEREAALDRLRALEADHPSVHEQKAEAYLKLGLHAEAERELRAGLALRKGHLRCRRALVGSLWRRKAWRRLQAASERAVERFPEVAMFRTALMTACARTGAPERALRFRDAILAESQPDFGDLIALGRALLLCGRSAEALEVAERAARAAPSRPRAHRLRADCLQALGDGEGAAAAKRRAVPLRDAGTRADAPPAR